MLYTEDFSMRHYVLFSQIGSRILLPRPIWLLLFYHTCMIICHIWVLIVSNIITTDIRVHIPHYIALFITHTCISSSPEKPSYLGHDYDYRIINHMYISRIKL